MDGEVLRDRRRRLGITQEELAERTGLSVRSIRDIEANRVREPRSATVRLLADALGEPDPPVPAQLPPSVPAFTGRADAITQLDMLLAAATPRNGVIAGTAGIGKTSLAVHWAYRVADQFPDGQLYVNLRGFGPDAEAVAPAEAVHGFLDALGVPPARIPATAEAQVDLYRRTLADRRVLVVLDNARDADQVRPLLPGSAGCLALVTSRNLLPAVPGAQIGLDLLTADEARRLLARRLGPDRVATDPAAVDGIIAACARLPLALAIVAARAATNPGLPLDKLAAELRDARGGLDPFAGTDVATDVRAVFSWSYRALSPPEARLFRLLGVHPSPDVSAPAAASLAGVPPAEVRPLLAGLARAHLVTEDSGRYACHDLLRAYAGELVGRGERNAAVRRMLDHYLHTALAGDRLLDPHRPPLNPAPAVPGVTVEELADPPAALAWFSAERPVLIGAAGLAARHGLETHSWQLAWTLETVFDRLGHWSDLATALTTAVEAARRRSDRAGQARAHRGLARAYARMDRHQDAHAHLRHSLELYRELGDRNGEASAHRNMAYVCEREHRYRDALDHEWQALDLFLADGDRVGEAKSLNAIGWYHALLGEPEQALPYCQRSLALNEKLGNRHGAAVTWDSLGYAHLHLGDHRRAIACYLRAIALYDEGGDRLYAANALGYLGDAHRAAGEVDEARTAWRRAVDVLDDLDRPEADQVRAKLDRLAGDYD